MDSGARKPPQIRAGQRLGGVEETPLEIVALSPGLGLGKLKTRMAKTDAPGERALMVEAPTSPSPAPPHAKLRQPSWKREERSAPARSEALHHDGASPKAPLGRAARWARLTLALSCDFLFVGATLTVAVVGIVAWQVARGEDWLAAAPLSWMTRYAPWQVLIGVYTIFLAYLVIFKGVAGRTVGEFVFGIQKNASDHKLSGRMP